MKKFPLVKQVGNTDCGPACLSMILSYYNINNNLFKLKQFFNISKNGISIQQLMSVSQSIGFNVNLEKKKLKTFLHSFKSPCIILWDKSHYVVVYKINIKKNKIKSIYVADPSKGYVKYSAEQFEHHWIIDKESSEGLYLELVPTDRIDKENLHDNIRNKSKPLLFTYIKRENKLLILLSIGLLFGSIIQVILPFLTQYIVDIGIGESNIQFIWLILIGELFLVFGKAMFDFTRVKILLFVGSRISISLISDFLIKLLKIPMSFFEKRSSGDILQRIEDHKRIERFLTTHFISFAYAIFTFFIFSLILCYYSSIIFSLHLIFSIAYFLWTLSLLRKRKENDYENFDLATKNKNITYQLINGIQEIKLQGCEKTKRWEWEDIQVNLFKNNLKALNLQQMQINGGVLLNELKNIFITVLCAIYVINGSITIGMLIAILSIIAQLSTPLDQIVLFLFSIQDVRNSNNRIEAIYQEKEEPDGITHFAPAQDYSIYLNNVSFKYLDEQKYVINNINLCIPENKTTAIVGMSGSGKTTLLKLLLGFYPLNTGSILIGKENLESFEPRWWRKQCGVVMQDGFIFNDSIINNIAINTDTIDQKRVYEASKIANIYDSIIGMPLQFNTIIGDNGIGISEGQKQRILISRVIYKDPKFVFLDEATNSLDANNEKCVVNNLSKFYKGKTVVVVAHRLSTVKDADQIVVLDKGCISEIGNHEKLINNKGKYYELIKNQLNLGM